MTADMPEYAREEFGGKIDDYDRALHHEIAVQLAAIATAKAADALPFYSGPSRGLARGRSASKLNLSTVSTVSHWRLATLGVLNGLARIRIEGFGQRAAIECAEMLRRAVRGTGPRAKVKFDHQIVAIAKVVEATVVYSDDDDVKKLCAREGIECRGVWDLPTRPVDRQASLPPEK